jgi:hypothetical protein
MGCDGHHQNKLNAKQKVIDLGYDIHTDHEADAILTALYGISIRGAKPSS